MDTAETAKTTFSAIMFANKIACAISCSFSCTYALAAAWSLFTPISRASSKMMIGLVLLSAHVVLAFQITSSVHVARPPCTRHAVVTAAETQSNIQAGLKDRMKTAMKSKAAQELSTVRLILAAFTNAQKETGIETLEDEQCINVLTKLAKMRKESIEMYTKAGAADKAESEKFELALIEEYLPTMADEVTVRGWIQAAIAEVCPDGPDKKQMGKVMGALNKAHKGEFDNKEAGVWVKEMLG